MELCQKIPEIDFYLKNPEAAIKMYFSSFQKRNASFSKEIIKQIIRENEAWTNAKSVDANRLLESYISISRHTDIQKIQAVISNIQLPQEYDNVISHVLYNTGGKELILVWSREIVSMKEHPNLEESFLVLEGTADCSIDVEIFKMKAGDFIQIAQHSHHEIVITSKILAKVIQFKIHL